MNPFLFYSLILIILTLILIGIIYLSYWVPKKMGKRKVGVQISRILTFGIILFVLSIIFEDKLFFKSDAEKYLGEQNIELKDEYIILENKSGGFMDYYHKFELGISFADKKRIINKIKSEKNYVEGISENSYLPINTGSRYKGDTIHANYQTKWNYKTEIYYPNGKGYTPTHKIISVSKKENLLIFEHILD